MKKALLLMGTLLLVASMAWSQTTISKKEQAPAIKEIYYMLDSSKTIADVYPDSISRWYPDHGVHTYLELDILVYSGPNTVDTTYKAPIHGTDFFVFNDKSMLQYFKYPLYGDSITWNKVKSLAASLRITPVNYTTNQDTIQFVLPTKSPLANREGGSCNKLYCTGLRNAVKTELIVKEGLYCGTYTRVRYYKLYLLKK